MRAWLSRAISNLGSVTADLTASLARQDSLPAKPRYYANPDWLIIDDPGSTKSSALNALRRRTCFIRSSPPAIRKRSTAVVTNVDFGTNRGRSSPDFVLWRYFPFDQFVEGVIIRRSKVSPIEPIALVLRKLIPIQKRRQFTSGTVAPAVAHSVTASLALSPAIMAPFFGHHYRVSARQGTPGP